MQHHHIRQARYDVRHAVQSVRESRNGIERALAVIDVRKTLHTLRAMQRVFGGK